MANVRLVRYVLCLVCSTILAVSAPWVTFSPNGEGEYAVAVGKLDWRDPGSEADTISGVQDWYRIPRTDVSYLW